MPQAPLFSLDLVTANGHSKGSVLNKIGNTEMSRRKSTEPKDESTCPLLSVIIPAYNGAAFLDQALASLCSQEHADLDVIVIDDGSTDRTREIIESYSDKLPLRSFFREHTGNWVTQTNFGLAEAKGHYVSILHQDDYWLPDRFAAIRYLTAQYPSAVVIVHPCWFVNSRGKRVGKWTCPFSEDLTLLEPASVFLPLVVQNFISMPAPVVRRDAMAAAGAMDEQLWFTADWKQWLRLAQQGPWVYFPEPLSAFRIHGASQTISGSTDLNEFPWNCP